MSTQRKKKQKSKQFIRNNAAFLATTISSVLAAVIMIVLVHFSASSDLDSNPNKTTSTPTITTTSTPTSTITGATLPIASISKGSADAPVTIIEYSDFQCSHCQVLAKTIEPQLEAEYIDTGKVRLIYKFIIGWDDDDWRANEAAACAAEQGQFWPYYSLLMAQGASPSIENDLSVEKLQSLAQQIGLDMEKFNASFLSGKYKAYVNQDDDEGRALGIVGTPTFFINGIKLEGASSLQDFADIIDPILQNLDK